MLALLIYAKNEQANISPDQRRMLLKLIEEFKARRRAKKDMGEKRGRGQQG